jgi:catechol 2,3-dioxygenase-like lactoylglutathione lyase family enzyme
LTERTIPILPCPSIDDVLAFYRALGFSLTYQQERPNTYAVVQRGGIELQFFVLKGLDPAQSYGSCYVLVSDVDGLYEAFNAGLREAVGRVPTRGIPRIGSLRDMAYGVRQFVVVDPGGNHIRIGQPVKVQPTPTTATAGRLERALVAAVILADSKGDDPAAAKVLDSAMADDPPIAGPVAVRALVLRADLAYRMGDPEAARRGIAEARSIPVADADRAAIADELRRANELEDAF